jgi:hypothetical protein
MAYSLLGLELAGSKGENIYHSFIVKLKTSFVWSALQNIEAGTLD